MPDIRKQVLDMAINGSGIRDTSRVLHINKGAVLSKIAKSEGILVSVNPNIRQLLTQSPVFQHISNQYVMLLSWMNSGHLSAGN